MTSPDHSRESAYLEFHEEPRGDDTEKANKVCDAINALTTAFPNGGWLSNLVWNTRNSYMAHPGGQFPAEQVQMICEGFLAEVATLRSQIPEQE